MKSEKTKSIVSLLTNDLPFGPYHRMTFADGTRSVALDGSVIGITRSLDNSTPSSGGVTQTFKMPVTACGNLQADAGGIYARVPKGLTISVK